MIFEQIAVGGDNNFAYLVGDVASGEAFVVDPSFDPAKVLQLAKQYNLTITYLINTHNHFDHTNGNNHIIATTGATLIHAGFQLGALAVKTIPTPGHTPDSICILIDNKLLTGDTLFVGRVGKVANEAAARQEYDSLQMLTQLPDTIDVYPGHDYGVTPTTTIGHEKKTNPYLLCGSFAEFWGLRRN
ncbi:MAG: MBL fold metallo-hydrolase [Gammaproteobacteria bacterium]|nr:MBL fold metallo-hydrolase [Gammaproteobacteria bacterium]